MLWLDAHFWRSFAEQHRVLLRWWNASRTVLECALAAAALGAFLAAPASATEGDEPIPAELMPPGGDVIPPGNDALLAKMVGSEARLPSNCKFSDGAVEYTIVRVTYDCPWGPVVLELTHPDQAASKAVLTERFAVTPISGSVPDSLADTVVGLIRQYEGDFEWQQTDAPAPDDSASSDE